MQVNFNVVNFLFECCRIVFEWERFDLESFQNDTSLHVCVYRLVSFQKDLKPSPSKKMLKYQHPTFEYKIHSVKIGLYYFKYL